MLRRDSTSIGLAAIAVASGLLLGLPGLMQPYRPIEFSGLIVAAIVASGFARRQSLAEDRGTMPPGFAIDFASLLIFGPAPATLVASAGAIMRGRFAESERSEPASRILLDAVIAVVAIQSAGLAHRVVGGAMGELTWPAQGVPIAAAVVAYSVAKGVLVTVVVPLLSRRPLDRSSAAIVLRECPSYFIGASLAAGLVEVLNHRMWGVFPVAAVPVYFAYRMYSDYVRRLEDEHRHREVV